MGKLRIRVKPNAKRNKVEKMSDGIFKIWVKSPSIKGKANRELLNYLKMITGMEVNISSGIKSKNKIINFDGAKEDFITGLERKI
jgi:uncharacterized protein (TIGR00251 family)